MPGFQTELEQLINRHSQENASNTPDFILAQYLMICLSAWNITTLQRETWYGRGARPTTDAPIPEFDSTIACPPPATGIAK